MNSFYYLLPLFLLLSIAYYDVKVREDGRFGYLLLILTLTTGPFGIVITAVSFVIYLMITYLSPDKTTLLEAIFPEHQLSARQITYHQVDIDHSVLDKGLPPEPFQDIMTLGTEVQKRSAIEKMTRYYIPAFYPALRIGLEDQKPSIRTLSATAIVTLDKQYNDRAIDYEKEIQKEPNNIGLIKGFAIHLFEYSISLVIDDDRIEKLQNKATQALERYLQFSPEDKQVKQVLSKLYRLNGKLDLAYQLVDKSDLKERLSILFDKNDYATIRKMIKNLKEPHPELEDTLFMWRGGEFEASTS